MKQNLLSRICGHALPCLLVAFLVPVSVHALQGEVTGGQQAATAQAEVVDVLETDTHTEIGQETPAATQTLLKMVQYQWESLILVWEILI